jgi:hypothetical protein
MRSQQKQGKQYPTQIPLRSPKTLSFVSHFDLSLDAKLGEAISVRHANFTCVTGQSLEAILA